MAKVACGPAKGSKPTNIFAQRMDCFTLSCKVTAILSSIEETGGKPRNRRRCGLFTGQLLIRRVTPLTKVGLRKMKTASSQETNAGRPRPGRGPVPGRLAR